LVYDAEYPTNAPTITFGATNFIDSSYFSTAPPLAYTADFTGTTGGLSTDYTKNYERNCQTRIAVSALVVDWDFKIFTDTTYYPETYTPPWVTNSP
jgi:hypothetical protein